MEQENTLNTEVTTETSAELTGTGESTVTDTTKVRQAESSNESKNETLDKTYTKDEVDKLLKDELEKVKNSSDEDYKKRLEALEAKELKSNTIDYLKEKELPEGCLDFVLTKDLESTKKNIDSFKVVFDEAVKTELAKSLKGRTPYAGDYGNINKGTNMADTFAKALRK